MIHIGFELDEGVLARLHQHQVSIAWRFTSMTMDHAR